MCYSSRRSTTFKTRGQNPPEGISTTVKAGFKSGSRISMSVLQVSMAPRVYICCPSSPLLPTLPNSDHQTTRSFQPLTKSRDESSYVVCTVQFKASTFFDPPSVTGTSITVKTRSSLGLYECSNPRHPSALGPARNERFHQCTLEQHARWNGPDSPVDPPTDFNSHPSRYIR